MNENIRQGIHLLFGLLLAGILLFFGREKLLVFTLFSLVIAVVLNLATIIGFKNKELHKTLSVAQRKTEKKAPYVGAMIFLVGVTMLTIFFQEKQILGGLIVLAVGDSFSTIIGKKFGKTKITERHTFEGTIAGIFAAFIGLLFFFQPITAILTATIGMASELLGLEDNITIPLASALTLLLL